MEFFLEQLLKHDCGNIELVSNDNLQAMLVRFECENCGFSVEISIMQIKEMKGKEIELLKFAGWRKNLAKKISEKSYRKDASPICLKCNNNLHGICFYTLVEDVDKIECPYKLEYVLMEEGHE